MSHTNEKVCLTVVCFLTCKGKVLLADHPKYDTWLPVGGHIDPGEDTDEALYREIKEETDLDPDDVEIFGNKPDVPFDEKRKLLFTPRYVDRHNAGDRDHVAFIFFGRVTDTKEPIKSHEHKELKWFSREDILNAENLKPDIVWYALEALSKET